MITQTVYIPVDDNSDKRFGWVVNSEGKGVLPVEKKENKIVMSIDEFRSIVAEAQGFSYDVGLDNCSVAESKKLSDTYINNLLAEKV